MAVKPFEGYSYPLVMKTHPQPKSVADAIPKAVASFADRNASAVVPSASAAGDALLLQDMTTNPWRSNDNRSDNPFEAGGNWKVIICVGLVHFCVGLVAVGSPLVHLSYYVRDTETRAACPTLDRVGYVLHVETITYLSALGFIFALTIFVGLIACICGVSSILNRCCGDYIDSDKWETWIMIACSGGYACAFLSVTVTGWWVMVVLARPAPADEVNADFCVRTVYTRSVLQFAGRWPLAVD